MDVRRRMALLKCRGVITSLPRTDTDCSRVRVPAATDHRARLFATVGTGTADLTGPTPSADFANEHRPFSSRLGRKGRNKTAGCYRAVPASSDRTCGLTIEPATQHRHRQ